MTAVLSPGSSPATSPSSNPNHPALPPLITSPTATAPFRRSIVPRPMSHASKSRLSQYSTGSVPSRSRPTSFLFPIFHSSLTFSIVRDFAYPATHPMHFGPPPDSSKPGSGVSTPASESRRLSDPPISWENKFPWGWTSDGGLGKGNDLAPIHFGERDGPPWSEDEDLQSPVVSTRHKKHKSSSAALGHHRHRISRDDQAAAAGGSSILNPDSFDSERGYFVNTTGDGSERYYVNRGGEADGPGGEFVTYPPEQARQGGQPYGGFESRLRQRTEQDAGYRSGSDASSTASSPGFREHDESRYSRDYQFTITSPDEEMHGKAVALFDFARENENELPLVEGQIIWVSYRHGQGWLVAEDPKTQESGLVPEEYVRLLRDIEGGMNSLTGHVADGTASPNEVGTPTQAEHEGGGGGGGGGGFGHTPTPSTSGTAAANGYHQPIVSTFSTSSKDLDRYPQHLLGSQSGQPPQVVHYHGQKGGGTQANTPTVQSSFESGLGRRSSNDTPTAESKPSNLETLPNTKLKSEADAPEKQSAKR